MEKCKYCQAEMAQQSTVCPVCGKDNAEKKATPGKIALAVAAVVILLAALIAIVVTGLGGTEAADVNTEIPAETAVAATIPADGNPEDESAKGTYTASDEEVIAAADTVVARIGDYTLTNGQLQVYYWMEVQNFLSSYGSYAPYFGLDYTKPLDTQVCGIADTGITWQQFFLASALNSWKNFQSLAAEAEKAQFQLEPAIQEEIANIEAAMDQNAAYYGFADGQEFLAANVGNGAKMADYVHYMELYYPGMMYFDSLCEANLPTAEEVEAYFTENEQTYADNGLAREDKYVDVRHVLIMPEGATSANIRTETFDEAAWEVSRVRAEELLAQWEQGDKSEDSFAALAMEHSQDGSAANGGLYTDVMKGQMVEAFDAWCFDEARQYGDYGLVETEFGYHLMFFVGSRPVWVDYVEEEMMTQRSEQLLNEVLDKYTMEADFENILLGYVNMGGESEDTTGMTETTVQAEPLFGTEDIPVAVIAGASVVVLIAVAFVLKKKEYE